MAIGNMRAAAALLVTKELINAVAKYTAPNKPASVNHIVSKGKLSQQDKSMKSNKTMVDDSPPSPDPSPTVIRKFANTSAKPEFVRALLIPKEQAIATYNDQSIASRAS